MERDFSDVTDVEDFASIPEGSYVTRIAEVREGTTRGGSPRWAMRLEVTGGDHAGRTAAWDGLVWSERGLSRVKFVLSKLGFDVSGRLEVEPRDLVGLEVLTEVQMEEREDALTGRRIVRPRVPFLGYESVAAARGG
jgi:hypothetical protein